MVLGQPPSSCLDGPLRALLANAVKTFLAIPGVGHKTAAALVALMPELGALSRRKTAALAGLAPNPNQSGQSDAYRGTKGGTRRG